MRVKIAARDPSRLSPHGGRTDPSARSEALDVLPRHADRYESQSCIETLRWVGRVRADQDTVGPRFANVPDRPPDDRGRDSPLAERRQREEVLDDSDVFLAADGCTVRTVDLAAPSEEELTGRRLLAIGGDGCSRDLLPQRTAVAARALLVIAADELVQTPPVVIGHDWTDLDVGRRGPKLAFEDELDRRRELLVVFEGQPRDESGWGRGVDHVQTMPAV